MSYSPETLSTAVEQIESKGSKYETATNFEAKKEQYTSDLSSVEGTLKRLQNRVERMEFLAEVLTDVVEAESDVPSDVSDARRSVRSVLEHDEDYYYELVEEGRCDQYEQHVQQAQSNVQSAIDTLEGRLNEFERTWKGRTNAARNVLRLFGESSGMTRTLNDIESFVERRMWDDSESLSSLRSSWSGLRKNWEKSGVDWKTFQNQNGLSDNTVEILKDLSKGESVDLSQLDDKIASELLSVEKLRNVVKLTI